MPFKNKKKQQEYVQNWRQENSKKLQSYFQKYYQKNKEEMKSRHRKWYLKLRIEMLTYYGNNKLACIWCGFTDIRALTIDHIYGRRKEGHKRSISGCTLYSYLKRNNFPSGYQTLCANCQSIKKVKNNECRRK